MENRYKLIWTFIITFIIILLLVNILTRTYILPISPVSLASSNMQPAYEKGDILFIEKTNDCVIGDVVLAAITSNKLVTRIMNISIDGMYSAKGDANYVQLPQEKSFSRNMIIGKVIAKIHPVIFYLISYLIQLSMAVLITWVIYKNRTNSK